MGLLKLNSMFNGHSYSESTDFLNEPIDFDEDGTESEFAEPKSKPNAHVNPKNSEEPMKAAGIELTTKDFNKAKEQAQKSAAAAKTLMENATSILDMLSRATINDNASSFQEEVISSQEEMVEAAALEAFENGIYFEQATDKNKNECKKKSRALRDSIFNTGKKEKRDMVKVQVLARGDVAAEDELWKIVGIIVSKKDEAEGFIKTLGDKLSAKLDGCKLSVEAATQPQLEAINKKRKKNPTTEAYLIKLNCDKK